jgi:hypothetical protein
MLSSFSVSQHPQMSKGCAAIAQVACILLFTRGVAWASSSSPQEFRLSTALRILTVHTS